MPSTRWTLVPALAVAVSGGCLFRAMDTEGGGEATFAGDRRVDPRDVALPEGYEISVVATGLSLPTGVAFDGEGRPHVVEAGYSYGELVTVPRLVRIEPGGERIVVAEGKNPPWNGVTYAQGAFFVAGGTLEPGQVQKITPDGKISPLVEGLPSMGDHHTNGPLAGPDGWLYFGVGTATNSAVVGPDNFKFGWPKRHPDFHDVPCKDVRLRGRNFKSDDPRTPAEDEVETGAYVPFGTKTEEGQVIPGKVPCSGAILRVPPTGGAPELVAWGFRNPFGLAFSPAGDLFVTENQFDVRGSRPVFGTGDLLWKVERGQWHGWPDFYAGQPLEPPADDDDGFAAPDEPAPPMLLAELPNEPPRPAAELAVHSSSNGFDFSRSPSFGHVGQAFVAQFGDMAPGVGKVLSPVGFKVVRVDVETGEVSDFAVNVGKTNAPASKLETGGLERPVAVRFDPSGKALYVVDFGVMTVGKHPEPRPGTGVLWRIARKGGGR